jgi:hypothetical protein
LRAVDKIDRRGRLGGFHAMVIAIPQARRRASGKDTPQSDVAPGQSRQHFPQNDVPKRA